MANEGNPVGWFEIYVQDMDRARKFYESTFETTLSKTKSGDIEMWGFSSRMDKYGIGGALVKFAGKDSGGGGTIVYFSCDDCAVESARAEQYGGQVVRGKMNIGDYGFIALVTDTEGTMIGLHSMA